MTSPLAADREVDVGHQATERARARDQPAVDVADVGLVRVAGETTSIAVERPTMSTIGPESPVQS